MTRVGWQILSPSDLQGNLPGSARVEVGGRVLAVERESLVLGDALQRVEVELTLPLPAGATKPGDLLVVMGDWDGSKLARAELVRALPHPSPTASSEQARFIWKGVGRKLDQRRRVNSALRSYFEQEGFIEIDTPFWLTHPGIDAGVEPVPAEEGYLVTSPELHMKRLLVGGFPRIFQFAHTVRRDELGLLHAPEFTLLEWYRAFSTVDRVQRDTESLVRRACLELRGELRLEVGGHTIDLEPPFLRITMEEAFRRHAKRADLFELAQQAPDRFFEYWIGDLEPALREYDQPVFLTDFPISQAGLAQPCSHDPRAAERFELYLAGVELCNGYGELTDPNEQRHRFQAENETRATQGKAKLPLDLDFLRALEEGMPPAAGNALGVDRLVMLVTNASSIQEVIAFPRGRGLEMLTDGSKE